MNLLSDIITYVRRLIKAPSNVMITDALIIDYINRFWTMDVDSRVQLFDLKTKYQFQTAPGYDQYNMPVYQVQNEPLGTISYYPVYQGFMNPVYINGVQVPFNTDRTTFFNVWSNVTQQMNAVATGNGSAGPYTLTFPIAPNNSIPLNIPFQYILRGHVDITGLTALANSAFASYMDPPVVSSAQATVANGTIASVPVANAFPAVYVTSNGADGSSIVVCDSGQFLSGNQKMGLMMHQGTYPNGNTTLPNGYQQSFSITGATNANPCVLTCTSTFTVGEIITISGVGGMTELNGNSYTVTNVTGTTVTINVDATGFGVYTSGGAASAAQNVINYLTGQISNLYFPQAIPSGVEINAQCFLFQCGLPRGMLFWNNTIILRSPPDQQYLVEIDCYLSPAAFLSSGQSIQFSYMCEYIARGAARKILSDTGDIEQFQFYEPLFREQEMLVWKRSQRQFTSTRTQTIYSQGINMGQQGSNSLGGQTN